MCRAPQAHQCTTVGLNQLAHTALTQAGEGRTFHSVGDDTDGAPHPLLKARPILVTHSEVVVVRFLRLIAWVELEEEEATGDECRALQAI